MERFAIENPRKDAKSVAFRVQFIEIPQFFFYSIRILGTSEIDILSKDGYDIK